MRKWEISIAVSQANEFWCKHQCDSDDKHHDWIRDYIGVDDQTNPRIVGSRMLLFFSVDEIAQAN
jgi:hypothetical protein